MNGHPAWSHPLHVIRDRIRFAVSTRPLREPSFRIVDALQMSHPSVQIEALFLTAVAMAETLGLDPHAMVSRARRQLPDAEGPFTEHIQTARDYARGELRNA